MTAVVNCFSQSVKTLDDHLLEALRRELPEWKAASDKGPFQSDMRLDHPIMHGSWINGERRLSINVSMTNHPEGADEDFRGFFMRQIMPPSRALAGIGSQAILVGTPRTVEIAFRKENLFVTISSDVPWKPDKKERKTPYYYLPASEDEIAIATRIAKILDSAIVGKRTFSRCFNDFYNPVFPRPRTSEENCCGRRLTVTYHL